MTRAVIDVDTGRLYETMKEASDELCVLYSITRDAACCAKPFVSNGREVRLLDFDSLEKYAAKKGVLITPENISSKIELMQEAYKNIHWKKLEDEKVNLLKSRYYPAVCVETGKVYKTSQFALKELGIELKYGHTASRMTTTLCRGYSHTLDRYVHLMSLEHIDSYANEKGLEIVKMDKETWRRFVINTYEECKKDTSILNRTQFGGLKVNDRVEIIGHSMGGGDLKFPLSGRIKGFCPGSRHPITVDAGGRVLYVNPREVVRV